MFGYDAEAFQKELDREYEAEAEAWIVGGMKPKMKKTKATHSDPSMSCIRTFTGKLFYPFKPSPKDVDVRDIAHGLSHLCRFAGQSMIFWSVAQHAMLAADLSLALSHAEPRIVQLLRTHAVLHHDDSEAYCIDLPKPIKNCIPAYEAMEDGISKAISEALNIDTGQSCKDFVKTVDHQAYNIESSLLFDRKKLDQELTRTGSTFARLAVLSHVETEKMFLDYSDMIFTELHEEGFRAEQFDFKEAMDQFYKEFTP
jgi:5'-deoxynucleotidase YfbR-like HD superfamily hydrolase